LNQLSALSVLSASAASVPPFFRTSFELTIPVDGFARIAGSWVAGAFERTITVYRPFAANVMSARREDGLPLRLTSRWNEKTASAARSGVPSAKRAFRFRLNVNVFASFDAVHDCTSSGIECAMSPPLYVKNVS